MVSGSSLLVHCIARPTQALNNKVILSYIKHNQIQYNNSFSFCKNVCLNNHNAIGLQQKKKQRSQPILPNTAPTHSNAPDTSLRVRLSPGAVGMSGIMQPMSVCASTPILGPSSSGSSGHLVLDLLLDLDLLDLLPLVRHLLPMENAMKNKCV